MVTAAKEWISSTGKQSRTTRTTRTGTRATRTGTVRTGSGEVVSGQRSGGTARRPQGLFRGRPGGNGLAVGLFGCGNFFRAGAVGGGGFGHGGEDFFFGGAGRQGCTGRLLDRAVERRFTVRRHFTVHRRLAVRRCFTIGRRFGAVGWGLPLGRRFAIGRGIAALIAITVITVILVGGGRIRQGAQGGAVLLLDLLRCEHHRRRRRQDGTGHLYRRANLAKRYRAALVGDNQFADKRVALVIGFGQQGNGVLFAFLGGPPGDLGAADADGGDRRRYGHAVRRRLGDLAADEGKHALHQISAETAVPATRIIDHFIEHHAPLLAQRECRVVDEGNADRGPLGRHNGITLIDRRTLAQGDLGAIGVNRLDQAIGGLDLADRLFGARGDLKRPVLNQRKLPRRLRSGQLDGKFGGDNGAAVGHQVRRRTSGKKIPDQDLCAVGPGQQQVRTLNGKTGPEQPGPARHDQSILAGGIKNQNRWLGRIGLQHPPGPLIVHSVMSK